MPVNLETTPKTDIAGTLSQSTGSQIMRDKLADIITTELMEGGCIETGCSKVIAALPDMVVPLVWVEGGSDSFMHDADFVDTTQTYEIQEGLFWYAAEVQGVSCGSNEAAKAAAQAHHVAQALSAFGITPPSTREET